MFLFYQESEDAGGGATNFVYVLQAGMECVLKSNINL